MQIYATLSFSGCSLLKATGNFSSVFSPQILHVTRSSTHSNVHGRVRLEGNWIKLNPPKLHRARRKEQRSTRKGICYLTPALHLIFPNCLETIGHLVKGEHSTCQLSTNYLWWCTFGQTAPCTHQVFCVFSWNSQTVGETSTTGKQSKERATSAALVLIDIPADELEYSNVTKLCYLTWESVDIRG